ncbi:MAG TPA: Mur ligase family protein, partial [Steroidobacteraceae bacterium]|nr:Mur ligase family protein [Steroidobacteraceae bacterium]
SAVTLTPIGRFGNDEAVHEAWAVRIRAACSALGWPDPQPRSVRRLGGSLLVFRAPADVLFTATDLNEWAWERAARDAGESSFDLAQDLGADALAVFAARAAVERRPELAALRDAAAAHGVSIIEDDLQVSLGEGVGSRCWPRDALPAVEAVNWRELRDIPTVLVTGSNGKTTTVRLIAAMAAAAGMTPGLCSTEGIVIGGTPSRIGDYAGPDGARAVLRDAKVEIAILETARGGILRRGLAVRHADAAIVTNISPDHLGEYGVDGADDLAETKLVVAHAVEGGGTLIVNADDAALSIAMKRLPHAARAQLALFAADYDHPALARLRAHSGSICGLRGEELWIHHRGHELSLGRARDMPLSVGGAARYNIANLSAAALGGAALGLPLEAIVETLHRFGKKPADNPGRLERWVHGGASVLIDYAHNPDGLASLLCVARAMHPVRLGLLLGQAGNRDDTAIGDLARTAARFAPDRIVVKELPLMLRGRGLGEVPDLIERALLAAGIAAQRIEIEPDEETAALRLLDGAQPGDVIVLPVHTDAVRERLRARLGSVR